LFAFVICLFRFDLILSNVSYMYKKVLINNLKVKNKYNVIKKIKKTKLNLYITSSYTLFTYGVFC